MPDREVFDISDALQRTEGDAELLGDLVDIFIDTSPELLGEVKQALDTGDGQALRSSAHSLKGTLGTLGAHNAFGLALQLEQCGRCDNLAGAAPTYGALERQVAGLIETLQRWRLEGSPVPL
jgi:two-component system, sensor histidine kinase and response regulator